MGTILHTALQAIDDAKTMLTPFMPSSSAKVHAALGGEREWTPLPQLVETAGPTAVGSTGYPVITGDYSATPRWESTPLPVGRPLAAPKPVFVKLDPSVVDEELGRLGQ